MHATWQGLAPVYEAPESEQLLAATGPVSTAARDVGDDLAAVGDALAAYAATIAPIKTQLEGLRDRATAFVSSVTGDPDWQDDAGKVNDHNSLLADINGAVEAWMTAQRVCANAISALYGGAQAAADAEGAVDGYAYGASAGTLHTIAARDQGLPWDQHTEGDRGLWGGLWDGVQGLVVDGVWAGLAGLGEVAKAAGQAGRQVVGGGLATVGFMGTLGPPFLRTVTGSGQAGLAFANGERDIGHLLRHGINGPPTTFGQGLALMGGGELSYHADHGIWAGTEAAGWTHQRRATAYGSSFVTSVSNEKVDQPLLVHEAVHAHQWALYGGGILFPILYGIEQVRFGNGNRFEEAAREAERAAKDAQ